MLRARQAKYQSKPSNHLGPEAAKYVRYRDGGLCIYCGQIGMELDHVLPKWLGGPTIPANMVLACVRCNQKRRFEAWVNDAEKAFTYLSRKGEDLSWMDKA
jgi:5-methylcytosine-specific restriction endonuclease McrA